MHRLALVLILVATNANSADVINLKHGVKFGHLSHQTDHVGVCGVCHDLKPGKIVGFGKTWAHKNCIDCHELYEEGPRSCNGCHKINWG